MADQYKVDLSELEGTISKLNRIISRLDKAESDTKSDTYLPPGALGTGFDEARKLAHAHEEMKTHIQDVVTHLNGIVNRFGEKTKKAHGNYQNSEFDVQAGFPGAQQN